MSNHKRFVSLLLAICMAISTAFAEEEKPKSVWDSIGGWFDQAAEDTSAWAGQALQDTSEWASQTWSDASGWAGQAWQNASTWIAQAWDDSSKWVEQAWKDSRDWINTNWDNFIIWMNTVTEGNPYSWINDMIGEDGLLAYNTFTELRSFYAEDPDLERLHSYFIDSLGELSLLTEDKETVWSTVQLWAEAKGLPMDKSAKLLIPFVCRLLIRGSSAIGEDAVFSGPVVTKYLLTILESMNLDSVNTEDMKLKILNSVLASLTRPVIIGDEDQNTLVTDDGYYIENFSYGENKYQILMMASTAGDSSQYPQIHGSTLTDLVDIYFKTGTKTVTQEETIATYPAISLSFESAVANEAVSGKAIAVWTDKFVYLIFMLTNQEWSDEEYAAWHATLDLSSNDTISFEVDLESDGAFYGINQGAQKYTITRIFNEAKFLVAKTGHGWAAERGNNLIDNIKGVFKGQHAKVVGDDNVQNGADRVIRYANDPNSVLRIQTKYYSDASRGIASCFEDGKFRYIDAEGKPMQIEVPADQYEKAVGYMETRIKNNEVPNVTDPAEAKNIVRKGNLTYQQARHIAKAGTVESILYDSAHACVTAASSMGLSAALDLAIGLWNGESFEDAIKYSVYRGLEVGGTSFVVSVFSSQLMKTGINSTLVPVTESLTKAMGSKASHYLVKAFTGKSIYGAAATKSAARLLRGNTVTSAVTFVVLTSADVADIIQGKISWKQLAKNVSTTAAGIGGGSLGYLGGAALGTAILPGAGTVVGIIIGAAAGWGASTGADALADLIAEDDADEMIRIIEAQFTDIALEYFLTEDEVNKAVENLGGLITPNTLKEMFQYKDRNLFARQLIEMAIDPVVADREYIDLPSEEEYSAYVEEAIEEMYEASEETTEE